MPPAPLILSPALPSELLTYIIQHETYPTTLIICSSRAEFLTTLIADAQGPTGEADSPDEPSAVNHKPIPAVTSLLSSPLYQVAIARHIRMAFTPTVSHLRAYLSVFRPEDSKVPAPPTSAHTASKRQPLLLVHGFLNLHRDTSEWSAQGISSTSGVLIEAVRAAGVRAVVVEPPRPLVRDHDDDDGGSIGDGAARVENAVKREESLLSEDVPILSASARRAGADLDQGGWSGRSVTLGRVLGRWFEVQETDWTKEITWQL